MIRLVTGYQSASGPLDGHPGTGSPDEHSTTLYDDTEEILGRPSIPAGKPLSFSPLYDILPDMGVGAFLRGDQLGGRAPLKVFCRHFTRRPLVIRRPLQL